MRTMKEVGEYLRKITEQQCKTAEDLAILLDTSVEKINGVFNGEVFVNPFSAVEKLCDYLNITIEDMIGVEYYD